MNSIPELHDIFNVLYQFKVFLAFMSENVFSYNICLHSFSTFSHHAIDAMRSFEKLLDEGCAGNDPPLYQLPRFRKFPCLNRILIHVDDEDCAPLVDRTSDITACLREWRKCRVHDDTEPFREHMIIELFHAHSGSCLKD